MYLRALSMRGLTSNIRLYKTICTYLLCLSMGITSGSIGPTMVHMEYLLHTSTQGMAMSITWECAGSLLGAILCARVCEWYGRWETQFTVGMAVSGLLTAYSPWSAALRTYCMVVALRGVILVYLATAAKAYVMKLWDGHGYKDAVFQGYITIWSVGAFISPIIAVPFLCHLPQHHMKNRIANREPTSNSTHSDLQQVQNNLVDDITSERYNARALLADIPESSPQKRSHINSFDDNEIPEDIYRIKYLFALFGLISIAVAILFHFARNTDTNKTGESLSRKSLPATLKNQDRYSSPASRKPTQTPKRTQSYLLQKTLEVLLFLYNCLVEWPSTILGMFLAPFVIKGLGWPADKGPLIVSVFRGSQGAGRIASILVSMYVSPGKMLNINMSISSVSYVLMLLAVTVYHSDSLLWFGAALAGLGISSSYSTLMLWGSQHLHITAAYCSIFSASSSLGSMTGAAVTGLVFDRYSPLAIIYILLACVFVKFVLFAGMNVIGDLYGKTGVRRLEEELTCVVHT